MSKRALSRAPERIVAALFMASFLLMIAAVCWLIRSYDQFLPTAGAWVALAISALATLVFYVRLSIIDHSLRVQGQRILLRNVFFWSVPLVVGAAVITRNVLGEQTPAGTIAEVVALLYAPLAITIIGLAQMGFTCIWLMQKYASNDVRLRILTAFVLALTFAGCGLLVASVLANRSVFRVASYVILGIAALGGMFVGYKTTGKLTRKFDLRDIWYR